MFFRFALYLSIVFISCNNTSDNNHKIEYNVIESSLGREDVLEAIKYVNAVLDRNPLLAPNWIQTKNSKVSVLIVQPEGLPFNTIAQSVPDDNVIFVSSDWKKQCSAMFETFDFSETAKPITLALILLHEVGHIVKYKPDSILFKRLAEVNLDNSDKMKNEIFADLFAITSIKNSKTKAADSLKKQLLFLEHEVSDTYYWRYGLHGSILSMMTKDTRKQYADFSSSHPNLNLRFIIMNYYLDSSKDSYEALKWAVEQRKEAAGISYPDPPPKMEYLKLIKDSSDQ